MLLKDTFLAVVWIRIQWVRIRTRIQGFDYQNWTKYSWILFIFFYQKMQFTYP